MPFDPEAMRRRASQLRKSLDSLTQTQPNYIPKVLFVDDDPNDLILSKMVFDLFACDVVYCDDSVKSLQTMMNERFDLIFIDMVMPKMTGLEVIEEVKKQTLTDVRFIAVTGSNDATTLSKAIRSGALFMVFPKPIREEHLEVFFRKKQPPKT